MRNYMNQNFLIAPETVHDFLAKTRKILENDEDWHVNTKEWAGKINKTRRFMAETGITRNDIKQVILELFVKNYCYTSEDKNDNFPNEQFSIFGITKNFIDEDIDLYIKLKIRKIQDEYLLIMSFHPEQPGRLEDKLQFPYKEYRL